MIQRGDVIDNWMKHCRVLEVDRVRRGWVVLRRM